jgi:hypothetical protein
MSGTNHIIHIFHHSITLFFLFEIDGSTIPHSLGEDTGFDSILGRVAVDCCFFFLTETGDQLGLTNKLASLPINSSNCYLVSRDLA